MRLKICDSCAAVIALLLFSLSLIGLVSASQGSCQEYDSHMASPVGGVHDPHGAGENSVEAENLARFAVNEHNKRENALLEFVRVVKAREQLVAGISHHLTIEAIEAGKKKLYEANVWVKPWMNFKKLEEFKHVGDVPSFTASDLGANRGDPPSGWQEIATHDPEVQNAANHALKTLQQRSNSLLPYELQEVSSAKAEVVDDTAKFSMVLRVKRGDKEEHFNAEVHQKSDGNLHLNQMGPYAAP